MGHESFVTHRFPVVITSALLSKVKALSIYGSTYLLISSLRFIYLPFLLMCNAGAIVLVAAIEAGSCPHLVHIFARGNLISDVGRAALARLHLELDLTSNPCQTSGR